MPWYILCKEPLSFLEYIMRSFLKAIQEKKLACSTKNQRSFFQGNTNDTI
ncbi:Uncharacterized, partial [Syntrophomonas zehnderi OL-4]